MGGQRLKRDMDLVRSILKTVGDAEGPVSIEKLVDGQYGRELVGYHIRIMEEAGLVVATIKSAGNNPYYWCEITRLTWVGNDFLDSTRDETVWKKTKTAVRNAVGSASFDVFRSVATDIASKMILSQIG